MKIWAGLAFAAALIDLRTREVANQAIDSHMRTSLVIDALNAAVETHPTDGPFSFNSDRDCRYTSREIKKFCQDNNAARSNPRKGNCWDNAVAESIFATMNHEYLDDRSWINAKSLRADVQDWVFNCYNSRRRHLAIGRQAPKEQHGATCSVLTARKATAPR